MARKTEAKEVKKNGLFRTLVVGVCLVAIFCSSGYISAKSYFEPTLGEFANYKAGYDILRVKFAELSAEEGWYYDEIERLNSKVDKLEEQREIARIQMRMIERDVNKQIIAIIDAFDEAFAVVEAERDKALEENTALRAELKRDLRGEWAGTRDFQSRKELFTYLTDTTIAFTYVENEFDCTEFAYWLMRDAGEHGFRLYPMVLFIYQNNQFLSSHMMVYACAHDTIHEIEDDWIYAIEPITLIPTLIGRLGDRDSWVTQYHPLFK